MLTKEEKDEISSLELRTLLDAPIERFEVIVRNRTFIDKILFRPKKREFVIYKTRVCNMARCAEIAYRVPELKGQVNDVFDMTRIVMPLIKDHRKDFLYLIAACIQNNSKEPSKSLIKFLDDNLHAESLNEIGQSCLLNSGLMSFFAFALVLKGVNADTAQETDADRADKQV